MRQVLAVLLVLALVGSALANIKDDRFKRRPVRDTRKKLAASIAQKREARMANNQFGTRMMDIAGEARKEAMKAQAFARKQKSHLDGLRQKFSSFKPDMEQLATKFKDQVSDQQSKMAAAAQKKSKFLNGQRLKTSMKMQMKKQANP